MNVNNAQASRSSWTERESHSLSSPFFDHRELSVQLHKDPVSGTGVLLCASVPSSNGEGGSLHTTKQSSGPDWVSYNQLHSEVIGLKTASSPTS